MLWQAQIILLTRTQRSNTNKIEKIAHTNAKMYPKPKKKPKKNGYTWKSFTNISFPSNEEKQTEREWCVCVLKYVHTVIKHALYVYEWHTILHSSHQNVQCFSSFLMRLIASKLGSQQSGMCACMRCLVSTYSAHLTAV